MAINGNDCLATDFVPRETVNILEKHVGLPIGESATVTAVLPHQGNPSKLSSFALAGTLGRLVARGTFLLPIDRCVCARGRYTDIL